MARIKNNHTTAKQTSTRATTQELIVQEINMVSPDRNRKDAGKLKAALIRAESIQQPSRVQLYDLYHDVLSLDGHLSGLIEKRTGAVVNKNIKFTDKDGKKIDVMDDLIYSNKFSELVTLLQESKYWGLSGVEFIIGGDFNFKEIPRKHILFEKKQIATYQYASYGYPLEELPYCWVVGKDYDFGKLLQCSLYALYKRSGFGDFAQYVEIFGQPVRIIYYDAYDTKTKEELKKTLNQSGSSLALMIPKQAQFQMLDGKTSNGNGELQDKFIHACNEEMSIAILGNSETTTSSQSSGYAQSKIHDKQQLEITKSDIIFIQNLLNSKKFLDILKSYGYPVEGGSFEFEKEIDLETLLKRLEIDLKVNEKVPFAPNYWYETYGIDKPTPEELKELRALAEWRNSDIKKTTIEKTKEPELSIDQEKQTKQEVQKKQEKENLATPLIKKKGIFQKFLDLFFGKKIDLNNYYQPFCNCSGHELKNNLNDLSGGDDEIYEEIARQIMEEELKAQGIPTDIYFKNADKIREVVLGSLVDSEDMKALKPYLVRNIYQFSAAKSLTEMLAFREAMIEQKTGGIVGFSEFKNRIKELGYTFNKNFLKTEYETAYATALMINQFEQYREDTLLEFVDAGDNKVRASHHALNGKTYPKNHPIWQKILPPLDFNCRCTIIPGLERNYKLENEEADLKMAAEMVQGTIFDNNPAQSKLIFTDKHPYFENLKTGEMNELNWSNYGLKSVDRMQVMPEVPIRPKIQTPEEQKIFIEQKKNHSKGIVINDPLGLEILLPQEKTSPWLGELLPLIEHPDEIWSTINEFKEKPILQYIKYYETTILVVTLVENIITQIFEVKQAGDTLRKGLLLYRK